MVSMAETDVKIELFVGVDTHKDFHVAVLLDKAGRRLADMRVTANSAGYQEVFDWVASYGKKRVWAIRGPLRRCERSEAI